MRHYRVVLSEFRKALLNPAWICFLWVGISIGITIIATPARFGADTATRAIALDISRDVFAAQNQAELLALIVLLVLVRVGGLAKSLWAYCAVIALILLAQTVWLLPELSARTNIVLSGNTPPDSYLHATYSSLELCKLALLAWVGFVSLSRRTGTR